MLVHAQKKKQAAVKNGVPMRPRCALLLSVPEYGADFFPAAFSSQDGDL